MRREYQISLPEELNSIAKELLHLWYTTFLLQGDLGVGKTQFVKSLISELGANPHQVQSPTYTYMNSYFTEHGSVVHMDLYRLEEKQHAFSKGIFEEISNHEYVCIERPKREEEYTDVTTVRLEFSFLPDERRRIIISDLS